MIDHSDEVGWPATATRIRKVRKRWRKTTGEQRRSEAALRNGQLIRGKERPSTTTPADAMAAAESTSPGAEL